MFVKLIERAETQQKKNWQETQTKYENLLNQLQTKELTSSFIDFVDEEINKLNQSELIAKKYFRMMESSRRRIINKMVQDLKLYPKQYHQNMWLALGMSVFGIPIGMLMSIVLDSMAFIGIGLPLGLSIGIFVGQAKDKKAKSEGKQIDTQI